MKYIGGYSILDLTDANVSAQANACYNQEKPVLVYGANGERYFADTITKSGTNIIVTKGGKTITIANDNTITNVGDIQNHLYKYAISFSQDGVNDGKTITAFILTNRIINNSISSSDFLEIITIGDNIILEVFKGSAPSAIVNDASNNYLQITDTQNNDLEYDNTLVISSVNLINQLF